MSAPRIDRVWPDHERSVDLKAQYLADRARPADRPWVIVGMIESIDGAAAVAGRSGGLGNRNDRVALGTLRDLADVIIVGAGTAAAEQYGPPRKPAQRIAVATNSGRVDGTSELFRSGSGFVLAPESAEVPDGVDVIRAGTTILDVAEAVRRLPEQTGDIDVVVAEGGPSFNGSLLNADLVDELCVTVAPLITGGPAPRIVAGAPEAVAHMRLAHLLIDAEGYQFHRYLRVRPDGSERSAAGKLLQ